jgi:hypothetical protein
MASPMPPPRGSACTRGTPSGGCNFDPVLKHGATNSPLFDLGVDFDAFYEKIWIFWARVLVLRLQFSLSW